MKTNKSTVYGKKNGHLIFEKKYCTFQYARIVAQKLLIRSDIDAFEITSSNGWYLHS